MLRGVYTYNFIFLIGESGMKAYIPNALSLFRMFAWIPIIAVTLAGYPFYALVLYGAAAITDWLDGYLARKWKVTSPFGQKVDQEADKVLVLALLIFASLYIGFYTESLAGSFWVAIAAAIFFARDYAVNSMRAWLRLKELPPLPSSHIAKAKTTVQMISVGCWFTSLVWLGVSFLFWVTLLVAVGMTLYTLWDYHLQYQNARAAYEAK
jgi:CDP-diacylglycerol--glycerol-3-phosphate 3-phosphatidyltransferase